MEELYTYSQSVDATIKSIPLFRCTFIQLKPQLNMSAKAFSEKRTENKAREGK
jgi:hypothetical protein